MKWTDNFVELATKASHTAAKKRTEAAVRKHNAVLMQLDGIVASQVLKDKLGVKQPGQHIRTMARLGLIRKVRHVPQHWEYEIIQSSDEVDACRDQ
jgi:hypothetical protein